MTRRQNRVFVALKLPQSVPALVVAARAILDRCKKHPRLKNPDKQLGGRGKREVRDQATDKVREALHDLAKCVETQANRDLATAESFVAEAGMSTRAASRRRKKPFTLKPGPVPGSVVVEVIAVDDAASYRWFCSLDGGKTCTSTARRRAGTLFPGRARLSPFASSERKATEISGGVAWKEENTRPFALERAMTDDEGEATEENGRPLDDSDGPLEENEGPFDDDGPKMNVEGSSPREEACPPRVVGRLIEDETSLLEGEGAPIDISARLPSIGGPLTWIVVALPPRDAPLPDGRGARRSVTASSPS